MDSLELERESLKEEIEKVFSNVPYPGDGEYSLSESCDGVERQKLRNMLGGKKWLDWKEKPLEAIPPHEYGQNIAFLSPNAYRYYLPLFLFAALDSYNEAFQMLMEIISSFTEPQGEMKERYRDRVSGFSREQLCVLLKFLDYMKRVHKVDFEDRELESASTSLKRFLD